MGGGELRRSYTQMDFALNRADRGFSVRPQLQPIDFHPQVRANGNRRRFTMTTNRTTTTTTKPTMEIYRPPMRMTATPQQNGGNGGGGVGSVLAARLNVHAKEFTMNHSQTAQSLPLQSSRSSGDVISVVGSNAVPPPTAAMAIPAKKAPAKLAARLYHSKSIGSMAAPAQSRLQALQARAHLHPLSVTIGNTPQLPPAPPPLPSPLQPSYSQSTLQSPTGQHHVHFPIDLGDRNNNSLKESSGGNLVKIAAMGRGSGGAFSVGSNHVMEGLKHSKSCTTAEAMRITLPLRPFSIQLGAFPATVQQSLDTALQDPNTLSSRMLMELVQHVVERAVESRKLAEPAAKLCITIIEKERKENFIEDLLNTCQLYCHEKKKYLDTLEGRLQSFMAFLYELYCQLKRSQLELKTHYDGVSPPLVLLSNLAKCCQSILKAPVTSSSEAESLYFVLTSIGRDLGHELPDEMERVMSALRDAFLHPLTRVTIRKTLLQIVELESNQWQLSAAAVNFYYPTSRAVASN